MLEFGVAADPAQVEILAKTVSDFCAKHMITRIDDREQIAVEVISLFGCGITDPDRLSMELEKVSQEKLGSAG